MKTVEEKNNNKVANSVNNKKRKKSLNKKNTDNKIIKMLSEYKEFYKENLKRKHIIMYFVLLVIFFVSLMFLLNNLNVENVVKQIVETGGKAKILESSSFINTILKENISVIFVILLAGITPYFYLPVIGSFIAYNFALKISMMYIGSINIITLTFTSLGMIIEMFGYALAIAMGIYFCKNSTMRFKYMQSGGFSFDDVKKGIFEIKKDEKNLEKINKKMLEKKEKMEKNNVKIPYKELFITFCISFVIVLIGTIFTFIKF